MGSATFAEQAVTFDRCFNFRDLGGYASADGRVISRGRVYRSDSLHRLGGEDIARFHALGIKTVVDLRTDAELAADGGCPVDSIALRRVPLSDHLDAGDGSLADAYVNLANDHAAAIASAIVQLSNVSSLPMVIHCTSGRDRTGVVVAMLLDLLGVDDEVIAADYMLTVESRARRDAYLRLHEPARAQFFAGLPATVVAMHGATIQGFLAGIRAQHGSAQEFLVASGANRSDLDRLQSILVDPDGLDGAPLRFMD